MTDTTKPFRAPQRARDGGATAPSPDLATAVGDLVAAGTAHLAARASNKIDEVTDNLDEIASSGGAVQTGPLAGVQASMTGKNPVWTAIKGAWSGADAKTRLLMILLVVAALLAAVVLLVVSLLGLLIAAIAAAIRAATK